MSNQLSALQTLEAFFIFFNNKKWLFAFFVKLILLVVGFLNRTGAKIGYKFDKKKAKNFWFIIEKFQKFRKCPPLLGSDCHLPHPLHPPIKTASWLPEPATSPRPTLCPPAWQADLCLWLLTFPDQGCRVALVTKLGLFSKKQLASIFGEFIYKVLGLFLSLG